MSINPYQAPSANLDEPTGNNAPALWNPNAAANWCLLLSVAFGSYLHMENWKALGEPEKARKAKVWVLVSLIMVLEVILTPPHLFLVSCWALLILFLIWYFISAKPQMRVIKERYGDNYPRKGWLKPISITLIAMFAQSLFIGVFNTVRVI